MHPPLDCEAVSALSYRLQGTGRSRARARRIRACGNSLGRRIVPAYRLLQRGMTPCFTWVNCGAWRRPEQPSGLRCVLVVDDPLAEGVNAEGDQRLLADHPED